jgi:hypothetical protein
VQPRRKVAQKIGHVIVDRQRLHQVVVVEDQRELVRRGPERVDQGSHDAPARHHPWGTQERDHLLAEAFAGAVKGNDHVPPEPHRVVVVGVQRQPRDALPGASGPVGEQGGLAEARGRAHENHVPGHPRVESLDQAGSVKVVAADFWDVELGGEEVIALTGCRFVWGRYA